MWSNRTIFNSKILNMYLSSEVHPIYCYNLAALFPLGTYFNITSEYSRSIIRSGSSYKDDLFFHFEYNIRKNHIYINVLI